MLIFVYIFLQMPRPKKAGGPMSAVERAQRSHDKNARRMRRHLCRRSGRKGRKNDTFLSSEGLCIPIRCD